MRINFEPVRYYDGSELAGAGEGALSGAVAGTAVLPGIGTAVGGLIGGAVGLFEGISQKKKAAALAASNPYPVQDVPQAEKDNQMLAKQMAEEGLPSQVYAQAAKSVQRNEATALRSATDRRAGVGLIGEIQQQTNDSMAQLNAQNAQARLQNQRQLIGVNNQVGAYQQSAFDWNQKDRYLQNYKYSQALLGAGNANIVGGIDKGVSALMPLFGSGRRGSYSPDSGGMPGSNPYDTGLGGSGAGGINTSGFGQPGAAMNLTLNN